MLTPKSFSPLSRRQTRRLQVLSTRWRRRIIFVFGGILVGAAAVGIALAADRAAELFQAVISIEPYATFVIIPLGFAVSKWTMSRFFPTSGGSGIPQAIAARQLHSQDARERLVSLRSAVGKIVLLLLGLACGASIGREGPTVQVGAAIMFAVGRLSPRRQPGLILAGASAGVAAAFNTPLAGIVFGIEELGRSFEARTSGTIIGAVIAAGLVSLFLQGDYSYFGTTHVRLVGVQGWLAVPLLGVAGGVLGGAFGRVVIAFSAGLPGRAGRAIRNYPIWFAGLCGLAVAVSGFLSDNTVFGTGYTQASALVQGHGGVPASFGALKLLATVASSLSGIPGGIFAPSLAVGAGLGANVAALLPDAPAQAIVVLGMVAYFSAVVQAPITAFVIVSEMTNNHAMIMPLMLASLIGFAVSRLISPEGIYHALARNFIQTGALRKA